MVISEDPSNSHLLSSGWLGSCHYMYLFSRLSKCRDKGSNPDLTHARQILFKAVCYRFLITLLFKWQKCRVTRKFTNETSNLRSTFSWTKFWSFYRAYHIGDSTKEKRHPSPNNHWFQTIPWSGIYVCEKKVDNESITVFFKIFKNVLDRFLPHQVYAPLNVKAQFRNDVRLLCSVAN